MIDSPRPFAAILAAAGRGDRARTGADNRPKQLRLLGGLPLISWSAQALADAGCDPVVAVVPEDLVDKIQLEIGVEVIFRPGGATRQESVRSGLDAVDSPVVIVHDAARPFVAPLLVERVLAGLGDADGAIPAIPARETVKRVRGTVVDETLDRSALVIAQTPQVFVTERLRAAHDRAVHDGVGATDDAELIERNGGTIVWVEGSPVNLKLTTPEDFYLAEEIARQWR